MATFNFALETICHRCLLRPAALNFVFLLFHSSSSIPPLSLSAAFRPASASFVRASPCFSASFVRASPPPRRRRISASSAAASPIRRLRKIGMFLPDHPTLWYAHNSQNFQLESDIDVLKMFNLAIGSAELQSKNLESVQDFIESKRHVENSVLPNSSHESQPTSSRRVPATSARRKGIHVKKSISSSPSIGSRPTSGDLSRTNVVLSETVLPETVLAEIMMLGTMMPETMMLENLITLLKGDDEIQRSREYTFKTICLKSMV
ncbi:hypothetical protein V2J09_011737 [Rumex salicifolius]